MPYFSIGKNVPGYSPQADDPYITSSDSEAKMALIDEMAGMVESFSDALNQADLITAAEGMALNRAITEYEEAMEYLANIEVTQGFSTILPYDPLSLHDLGYSFWITPIQDDEAFVALAEQELVDP
jgi:hypothetical protein